MPWVRKGIKKCYDERKSRLGSDIVSVTNQVYIRAQDEIRPLFGMESRSASIWLFQKYAQTQNNRKNTALLATKTLNAMSQKCQTSEIDEFCF